MVHPQGHGTPCPCFVVVEASRLDLPHGRRQRRQGFATRRPSCSVPLQRPEAFATREPSMNDLDRNIATAIIAMDTLWGGDVMNPSGMGRFIADSWYSDEPLPEAYTHPLAAKVREAGGIGGKDPAAIDDYVKAIDVRGAVKAVADGSKTIG